MLAQNYISIPEDGKENKAADMNMTLDITLNAIITKSSPNFKEDHGELITRIKTETDINSKYKLLKELHKEDLKDDAKHGGKKAKQEIERGKKALQEKAEKVNRELQEAKLHQNDSQ